MRIRFHLLGLVAFGIISAACDEQLSSITGPTPGLQPTFSSIQREIFETTDSAGRTACITCHTSAGRIPAGNLNLSHDMAYEQLASVPARTAPGRIRVIPGDPENSYLVHKIEGRPGIVGQRMPNNGPPYLTDGQILVIRTWIQNGAPND